MDELEKVKVWKPKKEGIKVAPGTIQQILKTQTDILIPKESANEIARFLSDPNTDEGFESIVKEDEEERVRRLL